MVLTHNTSWQETRNHSLKLQVKGKLIVKGSRLRLTRVSQELPRVLIWIVLLGAFSVSVAVAGGAVQEGNEAAESNRQGVELYKLGKIEEAVAAFKKAVKMKPDYSEAHHNLGNAYLQIEKYKEAVEAFKRAVHYQPELAVAHQSLGTAYYKLGEHKKATEAFKNAIRLNPKEPKLYYNLGAAYIGRNNKRAAVEQYKILKPIDPQLAEELYVLIYKPLAPVYDSSVARLKVIATDAQGALVNDLEQADFQVLEEGVPQTILSFSHDEVPLVYGLLVDSSGSIRPAFDLVIEASKSVIQNNAPADETLLIRFISSDKIETVQEFTSDQRRLNDALDTFFVEAGQSAIIDAVYLTAEGVAQRKSSNARVRRAVIMITDGDERSSYYSMDELLGLLRRVDVQLFVISIGKSDKKGAQLNQNQPKRSIDLLTKLAKETGGQAFFPKSELELRTLIALMMTLLRSEYEVVYKPVNPPGKEECRRVSINVVPKPGRENWQVHTRAGYCVPEKMPEK